MTDPVSKLKNIIPRAAKVAEPVDFLSNITSLITFFAPFFGFMAVNGQDMSFTIPQMTLPFRLLVLVVISAVLGWGLGAAVAVLTRRNSPAIVVVVAVVSIAWALMLVTCVDWLHDAGSGRSGAIPEFSLFLLIGLGLMLWLLTFQMRASADVGNATTVNDRALMIVLFTATTLLGGLLVNVGDMS